MAIDEGLTERVREILQDWPRITEKAMFGGMAFLCGGHLFLGVRAERLLVRVGTDRYDEALALRGVRPMRQARTGRTMTGYVFVDAPAFDEDDELRRFVEWAAGVAAALPAKAVTRQKKAPTKSQKAKPKR